MEYIKRALFSLYLNILAAYALYGWVFNGTPLLFEREPIGEGHYTGYGYYCLGLDGKPYDSGDARAG